MLRIVDSEWVMHETPLETIQMSGGTIQILADDIHEKRIRLVFQPYQAVKITTVDCADRSVLESCPEVFGSGVYQRYLLEETESRWIPALRESLADPEDDFLDRSRHFVLHLGDNLVEIAAWDVRASYEV